jgi:hypothetical protein
MFELKIEGFVGSEPELREVNTEKGPVKVLNFRVAVSNGQPKPKEEVLWFNTSLWGKMAEDAAGKLEKGNFVIASAFWLKPSVFGEGQVSLALKLNRFRYFFPGTNGTKPKSEEDYNEIPFDDAAMEFAG